MARSPRTLALVLVLVATVTAALLCTVPLLAVPAYESGVVVAAVSGLGCCLLSARGALRRPAPTLLWGLLQETPGEQVARETRATLATGLLMVTLPLVLLATEAARQECRAAAGLPAFLLCAAPAPLLGSALGTLAGSACRSGTRAAGLVALTLLASAALTFGELMRGPRHLLHEWLLGPLSASALTGYDAGSELPASAWLHRAFGIVWALTLLALASWLRARRDAPPAGPDAAGDDDLGWRTSRSDEPARLRFLLAHERVRARRAVLACLVALVPFVAFADRCGLAPGRGLLEADLPEVLETPHARIHHASDSSAVAHLGLIAVDVETAWQQDAAALGLPHAPVVDVWIHRDADSLFALTGARGYLFAAPWNHEVHVVLDASGRAAALRHEMVHVLAAGSGVPPFRVSTCAGLTEGLASAIDEGLVDSPEAHVPIAAALAAGMLPSARALMSPFGFFAGNVDRAYRASASFVGFLLRRSGPRPLLAAYSTGSFARAYGTSLDQLDGEWRDFLTHEVHPKASEALDARRRFDPVRRPALRKIPCGRAGRLGGDGPADRAELFADAGAHADAFALYCEAWRSTHEPETLERAVAESLAAGRREEALALVEHALPVVDEAFQDHLLRDRARILAALGRADDAAAALQDRRDAGLAAEPEEVELDALALRDPACGVPYFAALTGPAFGGRQALARLAGATPPCPAALHEVVVRELRRSGAPDQGLEDLVDRFAQAAQASPRLAGRVLFGLSAREEEGQDFARSEALCERILALPDVSPEVRRLARDGVFRAGVARSLRELLAQQRPVPCRQ